MFRGSRVGEDLHDLGFRVHSTNNSVVFSSGRTLQSYGHRLCEGSGAGEGMVHAGLEAYDLTLADSQESPVVC